MRVVWTLALLLSSCAEEAFHREDAGAPIFPVERDPCHVLIEALAPDALVRGDFLIHGEWLYWIEEPWVGNIRRMHRDGGPVEIVASLPRGHEGYGIVVAGD